MVLSYPGFHTHFLDGTAAADNIRRMAWRGRRWDVGVPAGVPAHEVTLGDRLRHMLLPAVTLSIIGVANVALHTRTKTDNRAFQRLCAVRPGQG